MATAFSLGGDLVHEAIKNPAAVQVKDHTDITKEDRDARMKWWRDGKFGVFIHFGIYSVPAGEYKGNIPHPCAEWIMNFAHIPAAEYREYAKQMTLSRFDADRWVKAIADAGAKYIVITTKHHDGFSMFDSALTPYNIKKATPYGKDFLKELSAACKKHGVRFGTYYSVLEWDNPALGTIPARDKAKYMPFMKGQLAELIGRYGTDILWFDGEWEGWWKDEDGREIYNYLRTLKPGIIVNNRITKARQGMQGMSKNDVFGADFGTPEQEVPDQGLPGVDWESCITMNRSWGYSRKDEDWKSTDVLIHQLIDTVSKGGNYLLNIGPRPDGSIPEASLERLKQMGRWMKKNGSALYGTQPAPFKKMPWGRATRKGDTYYFFVYDRPDDQTVLVPFAGTGAVTVKTLDGKVVLPAKQTDRGLIVHVDKLKSDDALPVVFTMTGKGTVIDGAVPGKNGSFTLDADSAELAGGLKVQESSATGQLVGAAEKREKNIGFWTSEQGRAEWTLNVPSKGMYQVDVTFACNKGTEGSRVVIAAGDGSLDWVVPSTGSWQAYRTVSIGRLALPAGKTVLKMSAAAKPSEGVANVREITLKPVQAAN